MSRASGRRRMLFVSLGISSAFWLVDALTPDSKTKSATAATAPVSQPSATSPAPTSGESIAALIAAITNNPDEAGTNSPYVGRRNLFAVSERMAKTIAAAGKAANPPPPEPPAAEPVQLEFEQRHTLHGVMMGRVPLAVIDDQVVSTGAIIDGYEVVEIHRDSVVLRGDDTLARLTVRGP